MCWARPAPGGHSDATPDVPAAPPPRAVPRGLPDLQRAHQNSLENLPTFLSVSGRSSAAAAGEVPSQGSSRGAGHTSLNVLLARPQPAGRPAHGLVCLPPLPLPRSTTQLLITTGVRFPIAASLCGLLYLAGRVAYFQGASAAGGGPAQLVHGRRDGWKGGAGAGVMGA